MDNLSFTSSNLWIFDVSWSSQNSIKFFDFHWGNYARLILASFLSDEESTSDAGAALWSDFISDIKYWIHYWLKGDNTRCHGVCRKVYTESKANFNTYMFPKLKNYDEYHINEGGQEKGNWFHGFTELFSRIKLVNFNLEYMNYVILL